MLLLFMSFQAYIDNIKAKTGLAPEDFANIALEKGIINPTTKASEIISWLKKDYQLGHGHSMAIVKTFKEKGVFPIPKKKK